VATIVGKSSSLQVTQVLETTLEENLSMISNSIGYLKAKGLTVFFDAEHFFDGYKNNPEYALKTIQAAQDAGADCIVLCDTNGGTLPSEVFEIVGKVKEKVDLPVGIHAHNDSDVGVANSIMAVEAGAVHVQGTMNGVGERTGNANLCSILPNLKIKLGYEFNDLIDVSKITALSHFISEIMNIEPNSRAPFVGISSFAHKGGIHVSSVLKDSRMYEHIDPKEVGNLQRVVVSDLSGQSNIRYKAKEFGIELPDEREFSKKFVSYLKEMEYDGYQFDGAEATFELLLRAELKEYEPFFNVTYSKINVLHDRKDLNYSEAVLKVEVDGEVEHTAADGNGPVNALDGALRKALTRFFPIIEHIKLVDYKVRVLGERNGTKAKVRVLIESSDGEHTWSTVGVSQNIIEASLMALTDAMNYKLFKETFSKKKNLSETEIVN
jgi:2-isopropylmalate synthase